MRIAEGKVSFVDCPYGQVGPRAGIAQQYVLFGGEVQEKRAFADVGGFGDVGHAGLVVAPFGE